MASLNISYPTPSFSRSNVSIFCNGNPSDLAFVRLGSNSISSLRSDFRTRAAGIVGEGDVFSTKSAHLGNQDGGIEIQPDSIAFGTLSAETAPTNTGFPNENSEFDLDLPTEGFNSIPEAIEDIRKGKMVVVVDDEDRENERDLIMAASLATPEAMAFIVKHGTAIVCVSMMEDDHERLQLPLMVTQKANEEKLCTAVTVSVDVPFFVHNQLNHDPDDVIVIGILTAKWSSDLKDLCCDLDPVVIANYVRRTNDLKADIDMPIDIIMQFRNFWSDFQATPLKGRNAILRGICPQCSIKLTIVVEPKHQAHQMPSSWQEMQSIKLPHDRMTKAAGLLRESDFKDLATPSDIQLTKPRFVNWPAMPTRTANQIKVSHADFSLKQSSQSSTPNNRRTDNPSIAATTLEMPIFSLKTSQSLSSESVARKKSQINHHALSPD
ncbi:3,4-dihydroxy-2-butanone 4-phosphate synthase, RibB [Dillenia turbinata]|uniref:3,4-dihydroxy-2-butanone 4-phosphate synthase, RibB n=1 Tax=Dillenia turbinata TaxID=194707 RepID=A0AAN8W3R4_9MAGN